MSAPPPPSKIMFQFGSSPSTSDSNPEQKQRIEHNAEIRTQYKACYESAHEATSDATLKAQYAHIITEISGFIRGHNKADEAEVFEEKLTNRINELCEEFSIEPLSVDKEPPKPGM